MQSKFGLVALSAIATLVLFGGNTVEAKSNGTAKKEDKKIVVTVKAGDTLEAIAKKHKTTYTRIFDANKKIENPDLIMVGDKVRIPKKDEKLEARELQSVVVAPVQVSAATPPAGAYQQPASSGQVVPDQAPTTYVARGTSAGNTYGYGWCTWYVKNQRPDLPNNLGNGGQWVANAAAQGLATGNTPRVGAVAEEPGHVAYVEAVNGGMITISEMGWNYSPGQFNRRTVPAANYRYIY